MYNSDNHIHWLREGGGDILLAHSDQVIITAPRGQASNVEISTTELAPRPSWNMCTTHVGLRENNYGILQCTLGIHVHMYNRQGPSLLISRLSFVVFQHIAQEGVC